MDNTMQYIMYNTWKKKKNYIYKSSNKGKLKTGTKVLNGYQ